MSRDAGYPRELAGVCGRPARPGSMCSTCRRDPLRRFDDPALLEVELFARPRRDRCAGLQSTPEDRPTSRDEARCVLRGGRTSLTCRSGHDVRHPISSRWTRVLRAPPRSSASPRTSSMRVGRRSWRRPGWRPAAACPPGRDLPRTTATELDKTDLARRGARAMSPPRSATETLGRGFAGRFRRVIADVGQRSLRG